MRDRETYLSYFIMAEELKEDIGNPDFYKHLRLPKDEKLKSLYPLIMKKIPKKVTWSTITLHTEPTVEYVMYNRSDKKTISDSHVNLLEKFGERTVESAVSNIDYGEYYFDIYLQEEKA